MTDLDRLAEMVAEARAPWIKTDPLWRVAPELIAVVQAAQCWHVCDPESWEECAASYDRMHRTLAALEAKLALREES